MRTVVSNKELPHLWAHQTQSHARNGNDTFYFSGDTIYSYGSHFPIAKHVTNSRGDKAILFTTSGYSTTTSQHISLVRHSIPGGVLVFNVDLYKHVFTPETEIAHYNERIQALERSAVRRRSEDRKNWDLGEAASVHSEAVEFARFFDISTPVVPLTTDMESLKKAVAEEAARKAQETREKALEAERKYADDISQWLEGKPVYFPHDADTALRVKGDVVETSKGAVFPVSHAKLGLKIVDSVVKKGEVWKPNGHSIHLGNYHIDRIDANGTVHAGCHVVKYKAINRIRKELE